MTTVNNFSARVLSYMQTKNVSQDEAKKKVSEEIEKEKQNGQNPPSDYKENNKASQQQLDYQAAMNAFLVTNKANSNGANVYTLTSSKAQTIVVNGQNVKIVANGASQTKNVKITVDKDGKINVESNGATGIIFTTDTDLNINIVKSTANLSITTGNGNDIVTIQDDTKISKVSTGNGNDIIVNNSSAYTNTTLDGGTGNDVVINGAQAGSLTGGAGDDILVNLNQAKSISAGSNNDTIINDGIINGNVIGSTGNDIFIQGKNGLVKGSVNTANKTIADFTTVNNVLYKDNIAYTGVKDDVLYKNGKKNTLTTVFDGILYKNGTKATGTTIYNNTLFINGENSKGLITYNNYLYSDGVKFTGMSSKDGLYYNNGKVYTGEVKNGTSTTYYNKGVLNCSVTDNNQNKYPNYNKSTNTIECGIKNNKKSIPQGANVVIEADGTIKITDKDSVTQVYDKNSNLLYTVNQDGTITEQKRIGFGITEEKTYDPKTGNMIYEKTTNMLDETTEKTYDPKTGNMIYEKTTNVLHETTEKTYDRQTGKLISEKYSDHPGIDNTTEKIWALDGKLLSETVKDCNDKMVSEKIYDSKTGNLISEKTYDIFHGITEKNYDPQTGNITYEKTTDKSSFKITEKTWTADGKLLSEKITDLNGKIISEKTYNPQTGEIVSEIPVEPIILADKQEVVDNINKFKAELQEYNKQLNGTGAFTSVILQLVQKCDVLVNRCANMDNNALQRELVKLETSFNTIKNSSIGQKILDKKIELL